MVKALKREVEGRVGVRRVLDREEYVASAVLCVLHVMLFCERKKNRR